MTERILFCTSVFREDINSSGRHMIDLVKEFDVNGHQSVVITNLGKDMPELQNTSLCSLGFGLQGLSKPVRLIFEMLTPILLHLKYYLAYNNRTFDSAVVYSPSIFWFVSLKLLGNKISGKKLLILRDLFPLWLADVGLMKTTGITYRVLDYFCQKQLSNFDVILVQDQKDVNTLMSKYNVSCEIGVLQNWYSSSPLVAVSDEIKSFCNRDAFHMCVAGNFGVAQDLERSCDILEILLLEFSQLNILFVGQQGSSKLYFEKKLRIHSDRVKFIGKMSHDEIINILDFVDAGFFSLNTANQQGHLPGKVLAYIMAGCPTFGYAGPESPISALLEEKEIGSVVHTKNKVEVVSSFRRFMEKKWSKVHIKSIADKFYRSENAYRTVKGHLENE